MFNDNQKNNSGFTMVEIIIALVILAILAAIIVPVSLSIISSNKETEAKMMGKTIMNAVQSEFNNLAANDEIWISNGGKIGIIFNKDRRSRGGKKFENANNFYNGFIKYIYDTVPVDNIMNKIDNVDDIYMFYVGAGKVYQYYYDDNRKKMYTVYIVIYQMKDDDTIYIYDGKNVSKTWPFSSPEAKASGNSQKGDSFILNGTYIQLYGLKVPNKKADGHEYTFWNDTVVPTIYNQTE